jgi:hypothetical protein
MEVRPWLKGEDGTAQADELLAILDASSLAVGMVGKETQEGALTKHAAEALKVKGTAVAEVGAGLADVMAAKDAAEAGPYTPPLFGST